MLPYRVKLTFFKPSGKWYASGEAIISHGLWDLDKFKQDILNTQTALVPNWAGEFSVMTESLDEEVFATHWFPASAFSGMTRTLVGEGEASLWR